MLRFEPEYQGRASSLRLSFWRHAPTFRDRVQVVRLWSDLWGARLLPAVRARARGSGALLPAPTRMLLQSARAREGRVKSEAGFALDRAPTYFFARAIRKLFDLFKVTQTILAQRFDCDAGGVYASNSDVTTMFSSRARVKRCAIRRESRREARTAPAASMRPTPNSRCHLLPIMVYRGEFRAQSARTRTKSEQREIASLNPERTPRVAA